MWFRHDGSGDDGRQRRRPENQTGLTVPRIRAPSIPPMHEDASMLISGTERFGTDDLEALSELAAHAWLSASDADWSVQAGTVEWSCLRTADHAVDCVWAPVFFLSSRRTDRYPEIGLDLGLGDRATPVLLVESLRMATRVLCALVRDSAPDVRSIIFRRPQPLLGAPEDFLPRAAMELILHAHDVCIGLGVPFEPSADVCRRLRDHTRPWPMWTLGWDGLPSTEDPWGDLLAGSDRARA
jgi:hypothetical protein